MERGRANLIKYADICYIPLICFVKHKLCYGNIASPVDAIICTSVSPAAALFAPRPSFGSPAIESIEGLLGDVLLIRSKELRSAFTASKFLYV
nr:hypothetical protein Iba_chr10eCG14520 [Ipomoea batatas]